MGGYRGDGYRTALLAVFASWTVLTWPWLSGAVTVPYDAKAHFYPQLQFLAQALHTGQSPFWNPHIFAGSPQIADPQSLIFSPAVLIAAFSADPSFRALDVYVLGLLLMGALSLVMFFRVKGWHAAGATVAGIAFAFGGSSIWRVQHIKQVQSLAFFALALWLLSRALERRRARDGIAAGIAIGLMVAESGQVALLGVYTLAGYALVTWLGQDDRVQAFRGMLPALAACSCTVILVAGLPVLLTMKFVAASSRIDIPFEAAGRGSLHPGSLLTLIIGDLFSAAGRLRSVDVRVDYWGPPSPGWNPDSLAVAHNMCQLYCGALVGAAVLVLGLMRGGMWRQEILFFSLCLLAMTFYALGWYSPVFKWYYEHVPFVRLFRRPADATFMIGASMAVVSGYLVHLAATEKEGWSIRQGIAVLAIVFATGIAIAIWKHHALDAVEPLLISAALVLISLQVLRLLPELDAHSPLAAVVVVAALMTVDLALINGSNGSIGLPPSQYPMLARASHEPTIEFIKERLGERHDSARRDRVELAGLGFEWPNTGMIHGFDHVLGYNPLRLAPVSEGIGAGDTIAIPVQRRFSPLFDSYTSMLARMLGLRFIATTVPIESIDKSLQPGQIALVETIGNVRIYEKTDALPRVLFVANAMAADFRQVMVSGRWPDFDPSRVVLLRPDDVREPAVQTVASGETVVRSAVLTRYENTSIEVDVTATAPGYVVLNDIWHPWWRATIDDMEAPVLKANVMFRAVPVPTGKHRIRLTFAPLGGVLRDVFAQPALVPEGDAHAEARRLPRQ